MTPEIFAARAESFTSTEPVPGVVIHITQDLPYGPADGQHQSDAENIAGALWLSLPGGTLDRLTVLLLERQASRLRVSRS